VHNEPYYVDRIDLWNGDNIYTHQELDIPVLDRGVALTTIDVLKGVLTNGTARRWPLVGIPAAGKTGTQQDNTNAWFVGFTTNLTTAVWIGDPDAYTPMENIPQFEGDNAESVQGGRYPAQIWNTYMQPAHQFLAVSDWEAPPPPVRTAARLYLPGNECLSYVSGYQPGGPAPTATPVEPAGFAQPAPEAPPPTAPPSATAPPDTTPAPVVTAAPQAVYSRVDGGNTIPPDVLDPNYPVNIAPIGYRVTPC